MKCPECGHEWELPSSVTVNIPAPFLAEAAKIDLGRFIADKLRERHGRGEG